MLTLKTCCSVLRKPRYGPNRSNVPQRPSSSQTQVSHVCLSICLSVCLVCLRLTVTGSAGGGGYDQAWLQICRLYLSLHCHHQNDSCIKVGSDESHFNVSVKSDGQRHKTVSTDHNFWRERGAKAELNWGPSVYQTNTLLLGQTVSLILLRVRGVLVFCLCKNLLRL